MPYFVSFYINDVQPDRHQAPKRSGLTICVERSRKLSKSQQTFNRLTKEIEQLQKAIRTENIRQIRELAGEHVRVLGALKEVRSIFTRPLPKKEILNFVDDYI